MASVQYEKELVRNAIESAYDKGYEAGKEITVKEREQIFNHGLDAAWEAANWVLKDRSANEYDKINEFFGVHFTNDIFKDMSPAEAIEKIREYEKSRSISDPYTDLEVGDQVIMEDDCKAIIFFIEDDGYFDLISQDDQFFSISPEEAKELKKTGKRFEAIKSFVDRNWKE